MRVMTRTVIYRTRAPNPSSLQVNDTLYAVAKRPKPNGRQPTTEAPLHVLRLQLAAQHAAIARSKGQQARHREDTEEDSGELVQGLAVELGEELGVPRVREAHKNVQDGAELDLLFSGDLRQQVHRSRHADGRTTGPEVRDGAWVSKGAPCGHGCVLKLRSRSSRVLEPPP